MKSTHKRIRSLFFEGNEVLICLFPFYHQVFVEHYDWKRNLEQTFALLKPINWSSISNDIGFNSFDKIAFGILELHEPFKTELKEYCEWKNLDLPDYAADKIPEVILIPMIRYFLKIGLKELELKSVERFPESEFKIVSLAEKNEFEIYLEIENAKHISSIAGFEILLPDYDCPYAIISGDKEKCFDIVNNCNFECIETTQETLFDWWNQMENRNVLQNRV